MRVCGRSAIGTAAWVTAVVVIVVIVAVGFVLVVGLPTHGASTTTGAKTTSLTTTSSLGSSTSSTHATKSSTSTAASSSTTGSSTPSGPSVYVAAQFSNGTASPGVFTELANSAGEVATGYTPVFFSVQSGENYTVIVSDSSNHYFNQWQGGFSSRAVPVKANGTTVKLTAIFTPTPQSPPATAYSISVSSSLLNGTSDPGQLMQVMVDGYTIQTGYTPTTFADLEPGLPYQVVAYSSGSLYFRNFGGTDLNRYDTVTFNDTGAKTLSLAGNYQYVPSSEAAELNVIAELPNGTVIGTTINSTDTVQQTAGLWLTITPPGTSTPFTGSYTGGDSLPFVLVSGDTYTVTMTLGYGNLKFAYWLDNHSTDNARSVLLSSNTTLTAVYEET